MGVNNATSLAVISLLGCEVFPDAKLLSFSIERQNYKNITTLKTSIFFSVLVLKAHDQQEYVNVNTEQVLER